jgi:protein phosphatase
VIGIRDETVSTRTNRLAGAIRLANERIHRAAMEQSAWSGMGTTVVAAQVSEGLLSFAHVGDSRLYLIRDRTIQPLTSDHSWVAEQIRQGLLTEDEADRSPRRNIVTRAVGVEAAVDVAAGEVPLFPYDVLLLCTDGLTRGVSTSRILHHVMDTDDAQAVSQRLVALANDAGGEDNTTVVVLAVQDADEGLWLQLRRRLAI